MHKIKNLNNFLLGRFACIRFWVISHVPKSNPNKIRKAIKEKKMISFDYNGYHRIAEPHVCGNKNRKDGILVFQKRGQSSSGRLPSWRMMHLKKITNLKILDEEFPGRRPVPNKHVVWTVIYFLVGK